MALQNFDMQNNDVKYLEHGSNERVLLCRPASRATGAFRRSAGRAGQDFMGVALPFNRSPGLGANSSNQNVYVVVRSMQ